MKNRNATKRTKMIIILLILLFLPVASLLLGGYVSYQKLEPVYASSTVLYIVNNTSGVGKQIGYNDILVGEMLAKDIREMIKSRKVVGKAIDSLTGKDLLFEEVAKHLSVKIRNDTRIIDIKVEFHDAVTAKELADAIAAASVEEVKSLTASDVIKIMDAAIVNPTPVKPNHIFNMAGSFFSGLLAAICIVMILYGRGGEKTGTSPL